MKRITFVILALVGSLALAQEAIVSVVLHPAGSFKVKTSEVKGNASQNSNGFQASNIVVDLRHLQTGIDLRDKHTKKHLETDQFPVAVLVKASGTGGQGQGVIRIRGIEKAISGTYEVTGNKLVAHFPLHLKDFGIDGVKYMGIGVDNQVKLDVTVPLRKGG